MEDKFKRIERIDRIDFVSNDYPKRQQNHSSKEKDKYSSNLKQKIAPKTEDDTKKKEENVPKEVVKKQNISAEEAKEQMEYNNQSDLYRLMNIMNTDPKGAIRYLAEMSKKNANNNKPRKEKYDEYNR